MGVNLGEVATHALTDELWRRRVSVLASAPDVVLPGLTISPSRLCVYWRGEWIRLRPKEMEVLQAIAAVHPRGVSVDQLAVALYESAEWSNCNCVRVYVSAVRKMLPGLLNLPLRNVSSAYHLAGLDPEPRRTPIRIVDTEGER